MWISKEISSFGGKNQNLFLGKIDQVANTSVGVEADLTYRNLRMICPYGVVSIPVLGENALVAPANSGYYYVGTVLNNPQSLNAGEVGLFSYGGASIVLKNDGRVLINGSEFF